MQDTPEPSSSCSKRQCLKSRRSINSEENGYDNNKLDVESPVSNSNDDQRSQLCTLCSNSKSTSLLNLTGNKVMRSRLSRDWKMPHEVTEAALLAMCVECVCKLNMHSEVTRTLMQRLQRLGAGTSATTKLTDPIQELVAAKSQLSPPIADAEVSTTLQEHTATTASSSRPNSSNSSCSLALQAYSAQPPESPSATESGGKHNKSTPLIVDATSSWRCRKRLVCQHCTRVYTRKDHYIMHVRRCWRLRRHLRRSRCRVLNEAGSVADKNEQERPKERQQSHAYTYHCQNCDEEFNTLVALRQHKRAVHFPCLSCNLCGAEFTTKYEWDLHYTICNAKQEVLQKRDTLVTTARSTRARSRACSLALEQHESFEYEDEEVMSDEAEDAAYTRRMNFTGDWIVNHSRSNSNSAWNLSLLYDDYMQEDSQIATHKEYDLYLLDVLKTQVQLKAFSCFAPACCYQTNTLLDLMKHDYMEHWKMSWFYCPKCGDVFTSKVFLDYHLHRQNRGVYICNKCHDEFEFQHLLDRHLLLHSKCINYHCNYCRLQFLSEAKLLAHCAHEQHSPNQEPPMICIDRTLSISNTLPVESIPSQQYSVRILDMNSTLPWSWGSRQRVNKHQSMRFSIGICEFDNRSAPNCVGCQ